MAKKKNAAAVALGKLGAKVRNENLTPEELIREKYRGIRPAAGYPAAPDHTEKGTLFDLLQAEKLAGISLTESFAMSPGAAVSGLYFGHPEAKYFGAPIVPTSNPIRASSTLIIWWQP